VDSHTLSKGGVLFIDANSTTAGSIAELC